MAIREWSAGATFRQGECVLIPDGAGGYMGDAGGGKTWLLCAIGSGSTPDSTPTGVTGAAKTQMQWATLFEGNATDGIIGETTVMPATVQANQSGPDGTMRWGMGIAYFLDTSAPTNGNGSYASPFNTVASLTSGMISSQDGTNSVRQVFIKRGTTVVLGSIGAQWLGRGSSRKHEAKITDYGDPSAQRPVLDASATTGGAAGVLISKSGANPARYVTAEYFSLFGASGSGVNIFLGTSDASIAQSNITVRGVKTWGNGESGIHALTGGAVDRSASSTALLIEDCESTDNNIYGIAAREWWDGVTIRRCRASNNGLGGVDKAPNGAYGISTIGNYDTLGGTGGGEWVNQGGNVWRRTVSRSNPVVVGLWTNQLSNQRILTSGTYGSLAADYTIAKSGTSVEIRLSAGDNPNAAGASVRICYNQVKNIVIEDSEVLLTRDYRPSANRYDGDGVGIDHFSKSVIVRRVRASGNDGCGLLSNIPESLTVEDCLFVKNGAGKQEGGQPGAGISINNPINQTKIRFNTVADNIGQTAGAGVRLYGPNAPATLLQNNVIAGNAGNSVFGLAAYVDAASTKNAVFGNGNPFPASLVTLAGSIIADPKLSGDYRPLASSPLIGAGLHVGYRRDIEGKQRQRPPCPGAFDLARTKLSPS